MMMMMIKKEEEEEEGRKEVGEPIRKWPLAHYTLKSKILLKMTSADKSLPKQWPRRAVPSVGGHLSEHKESNPCVGAGEGDSWTNKLFQIYWHTSIHRLQHQDVHCCANRRQSKFLKLRSLSISLRLHADQAICILFWILFINILKGAFHSSNIYWV